MTYVIFECCFLFSLPQQRTYDKSDCIKKIDLFMLLISLDFLSYVFYLGARMYKFEV